MYSELRPERIVETIAHLQMRIEESFPESGLGRVTAELGDLARVAGPTAGWLSRPMWPLRVGAAAGILGLLLVMLGFARLAIGVPLRVEGVAELLQASEAAANEIVLLSLAIFFLISLETRVKRTRALAALHRLRSIVHIVDMHQLTKDPQHLLAPGTAYPPKRTYTRLMLARYLDFCSELLSLASKLAALHVQYLNDPVVLAAVNDIEALTSGLSNKIWQKIMILDIMVPTAEAAAGCRGGGCVRPAEPTEGARWPPGLDAPSGTQGPASGPWRSPPSRRRPTRPRTADRRRPARIAAPRGCSGGVSARPAVPLRRNSPDSSSDGDGYWRGWEGIPKPAEESGGGKDREACGENPAER